MHLYQKKPALAKIAREIYNQQLMLQLIILSLNYKMYLFPPP